MLRRAERGSKRIFGIFDVFDVFRRASSDWLGVCERRVWGISPSFSLTDQAAMRVTATGLRLIFLTTFTYVVVRLQLR